MFEHYDREMSIWSRQYTPSSEASARPHPSHCPIGFCYITRAVSTICGIEKRGVELPEAASRCGA